MGCVASVPRVKDCQQGEGDAQEHPRGNKGTLSMPPEQSLRLDPHLLDSTDKALNGKEQPERNSTDSQYRITAAEGAANATGGSVSDQTPTRQITSSPKSARSTGSSMASTVVAGGRNSSLPSTATSLQDIDELKTPTAMKIEAAGQGSGPRAGVTGRKSSAVGAFNSGKNPEGGGMLATSLRGELTSAGSPSGLSGGATADSIELLPPPKSHQNIQGVMATMGDMQATAVTALGQPMASFAGQWLPQMPGTTRPPRHRGTAAPGEMGAITDTQRASLPKQDMFKKAAYLSSGSVDSRPTYQRDAVDDDFTGLASSSDDINVINWKDMALGKGPLQGAAYGSMVMPQFKGGRRANKARQPLQNLMASASPQATAPVSLSMSGWASLDSTGSGSSQGQVQQSRSAGSEGSLPDVNSNEERPLGSIEGWQAIAEDVMAEGIEDEDSPQAEHLEDAVSEAKAAPEADVQQLDLDAQQRSANSAKMKQPSETKMEIKSRAQGLFYVKYELQGKLGEGAFGEARLARRRKDGQVFVVKIMHGANLTEKAKEEAKNEVRVLASLSHPNIVKYYETFVDEKTGKLQIVMEYCDEGDLDSFLKRQNGQYLDEDTVLLKLAQICLGLQHVHSKGIIHRDMKGNNIFCCADGILKLGDFGISKVLTPDARAARTMIGTPSYISPEILKGRSYDGKTDIWALGCILYELCSLKKAFDGSNLGAITVKVMSGKYLPVPGHYSDEMKALVDALIKREPSERPALEEVLQLELVRKGLTLYQEHIQRSKLRRQQSYERSLLLSASLDSPATDALIGNSWHDSHMEPEAEGADSPEDLKAKREAEAQEAEQRERAAEAARSADLLQLRALELQAARANLARLRSGQQPQTMVLQPAPQLLAGEASDTPSRQPAGGIRRAKPMQDEEQGRSKRSRFAPTSTQVVAGQSAAAMPRPGERVLDKGTSPPPPPSTVTRSPQATTGGPEAERGALLARGISSSFNAGEGEERDDVDLLIDTEAPEPVKPQGSTGLLAQIENLLQLPTINQLPQLAEADESSPRRREIMCIDDDAA